MKSLKIVILGLSITSSWGNGHATTYRGLTRALHDRGHRVLFLERDMPWYAANRDLPRPRFAGVGLYGSLSQLAREHAAAVKAADLVVVGSFVPQGVEVGAWVNETAGGLTAFYDIDTPVTLAKLAAGDEEYVAAELIPWFDLYLSFTGGPTLRRIEQDFGAPAARPLYCAVDPQIYYPQDCWQRWDLGYLGTYSADRQPKVEELLNQPARRWPEGRFVVAGPQYPSRTPWPRNVFRIDHLPPHDHRSFYNAQRFTLNITRADMVAAGHSPSVRLFEAAACGVPIISDWWPGLDSLFEPDREIVVAREAIDVLACLHGMPDERRRAIGQAARARVLARHTAEHRAIELEGYVAEAWGGSSLARRSAASGGVAARP